VGMNSQYDEEALKELQRRRGKPGSLNAPELQKQKNIDTLADKEKEVFL
jgi:hypothetical protein